MSIMSKCSILSLLCLKKSTLIKKYFIAKKCWPLSEPSASHGSDIKDHWPQITITYNNNNKVWNIARITKVWPRDMKWGNAVGKMASIDLLDMALP